MKNYLLLSRSITQAQRMSIALERIGVRAQITRPPLQLTSKGCGYAVSVGVAQYDHAIGELSTARLLPERVFLISDGGRYQEIYLR